MGLHAFKTFTPSLPPPSQGEEQVRPASSFLQGEEQVRPASSFLQGEE